MKDSRLPSTLNRRRFTSQLFAAAGAGTLGLPLLSPQSARGCCMVPRTYKGTISQTAQEAILFHKGDREELILRINYQLKGEGAPDRFAWVITVPTEPDRYGIASGKLFKEMFDWAEDHLIQKRKSAGTSNRAYGGIELGKRVQVGPYDIQPVRARGADALDALNSWLEKNGFPTEDPGHMKYFIDEEFTFLAIKISPPRGMSSVGTGGGVVPLHLSFKSEKVYYPLRFSSRQGVFDLNLYIFTDKPLDFDQADAVLKKVNHSPRRRLSKNYKMAFAELPESLRKQLAGKAHRSITAQTKWIANLVRTKDTNHGDSIASWTEDVFFAKQV